MIFVLAGTQAARQTANLLREQGYQVLAGAITDYGRDLLATAGIVAVPFPGKMEDVCRLLGNGITAVVDASHSFTTEQSQALAAASSQLNICYVRVLPSETELPSSRLLYHVYSWDEAARQALELGEVIFLTTGSYQLETFLQHPRAAGKRIVVRVLPEHRVIKKCQDLGLTPRDIIAMQGPFSRKLNKGLFQAVKAEVIVTKDSGKEGGTDTKVAAALDLGLPVVVLHRPDRQATVTVSTPAEVIKALEAVLPVR